MPDGTKICPICGKTQGCGHLIGYTEDGKTVNWPGPMGWMVSNILPCDKTLVVPCGDETMTYVYRDFTNA